MGKDLFQMSLKELWQLFPIYLKPHNELWYQWYEDEKNYLFQLIGEEILCYHIGSTAVKNIWAKPIIDIIIAAEDFITLEKIAEILKKAGYLLMSKKNNRISLNKGYTEEGFAERVFHIHLRLKTDIDEIYFRDYLNSHPAIAKEYEQLKLQLWKEFEFNRDAYTEAKSEFVIHYTTIEKRRRKMKSKVYFTKRTDAEALVMLYEELGKKLTGNVAVKLHSGEKGNQNYVRPEFVRPIIDYVHGTVVECNTAYEGARNSTDKHIELMKHHGWTKYFKVDILDSKEDLVVDIPNGSVIHKNYLGADIKNYSSMLVLSHFKGHPMGGFGGAIKQLSIGCASSAGKAYIHSAGKTTDQHVLWENVAPQNQFLESMADAAMSVIDFFKENIVYINMLVNLSVDCDCCAVAEDPCMQDIGMMISLDPIAIDQACVDMIYYSKDRGRDHFVARVERQNGIHTLEAAAKLGFGSRAYELINLDHE